MSRADIPPRRDPVDTIRWGDVFQRLTDWTNQPVDRKALRIHLQHRWFAPDEPNAVEALIREALTDDILTESGDGNIEYYGDIVEVSSSEERRVLIMID